MGGVFYDWTPRSRPARNQEGQMDAIRERASGSSVVSVLEIDPQQE